MWQDRMLVHANMASFGLTVNAYVSIIVNFSFGYSVTQIICTVDFYISTILYLEQKAQTHGHLSSSKLSLSRSFSISNKFFGVLRDIERVHSILVLMSVIFLFSERRVKYKL